MRMYAVRYYGENGRENHELIKLQHQSKWLKNLFGLQRSKHRSDVVLWFFRTWMKLIGIVVYDGAIHFVKHLTQCIFSGTKFRITDVECSSKIVTPQSGRSFEV